MFTCWWQWSISIASTRHIHLLPPDSRHPHQPDCLRRLDVLDVSSLLLLQLLPGHHQPRLQLSRRLLTLDHFSFKLLPGGLLSAWL